MNKSNFEKHKVEVLNPTNNGWFLAEIIDFNKDRVKVKYSDSNYKPNVEEVNISRIRKPPTQVEFYPEPQAKDVVEVFSAIDKYQPMGWWVATIKNRKTHFVLVKYDTEYKREEIVHISKIRPLTQHDAINFSEIVREIIEIPPSLLGWIQNSNELTSGLDEIKKKSDALSINLDNNYIIIIGEINQTKIAKELINPLLDHLKEVEQVHRKSLVIFHYKCTRKTKIPKEVFLYTDLNNMDYVKGLENKFSVLINIKDEQESFIVEISGKSEEELTNAINQIIPIEDEMYVTKEDWDMIDHQTVDVLSNAKKESGLIYCEVFNSKANDGSRVCKIIGIPSNILRFKELFTKICEKPKFPELKHNQGYNLNKSKNQYIPPPSFEHKPNSNYKTYGPKRGSLVYVKKN